MGGGGTAAPEYGTIGTAVTTTTTTTTTPSIGTGSADSAALYRDLIERSAPGVEPVAEPDPAPPFCFAMEQFVFESTQMFLATDVASSLERHAAAIAAIDAVTASAPEPIAAPAATLRQQLVDAVALPNATASSDALRAALIDSLSSSATLIDGMLAATIELCEVTLTDPVVPTAEGLQRVTGG